VEQVREWRDAGAVIQMDTAGLLGSGAVTAISRSLLEAGLVDLFSSDNHGDNRSLATARDWLAEVGTATHVDLLTRGNARRLLDDEPLMPVPPLALGGGPLRRLRELFFGSSQKHR
jgi:Capsular polysaccharide biosynthesis protein